MSHLIPKIVTAARLNLILLFILIAPKLSAQTPIGKSAPCTAVPRSTYQLGPGDELEFSVPEVEDFPTKPARIDEDGKVEVPLVGRLLLAGFTVPEAEQQLNQHLSVYIRDPHVSVSVKELRSQPVSVLGAVNTPGVHQLQGDKTLLEVLSLAGGLRPDAGYSIRITRQLEWGCVPLANASIDASGRFSVGEVQLQSLMAAQSPGNNIKIFPHDVISVPKAEMVYVIGEVNRSGGFVLGEHKTLSVLQALSLAEGLGRTADAKHARILRVAPETNQRTEIAVNVKNILSGKTGDVSLQGNDILFVPGSTGKKAVLRGLEAAVQTGTGLVIWR